MTIAYYHQRYENWRKNISCYGWYREKNLSLFPELIRRFGGRTHVVAKHHASQWTVQSNAAEKFLKYVAPAVFFKKKVVRLALELRRLMLINTPRKKQRAMKIRETVMALNQID